MCKINHFLEVNTKYFLHYKKFVTANFFFNFYNFFIFFILFFFLINLILLYLFYNPIYFLLNLLFFITLVLFL
jgi:hypothetical protein